MELRNLITFIQVAELGSFTKAGDKLGYSQPTVSFQIRQLENELGIKHFISTKKLCDDIPCVAEVMAQGSLFGEGSTDYEDYSPNPDDMATIIFTSGTTSASKAVMLSNRNIASNLFDLLSTEKIYPTDRNLLFLPLHHTFGSTGALFFLSSGATCPSQGFHRQFFQLSFRRFSHSCTTTPPYFQYAARTLFLPLIKWDTHITQPLRMFPLSSPHLFHVLARKRTHYAPENPFRQYHSFGFLFQNTNICSLLLYFIILILTNVCLFLEIFPNFTKIGIKTL